jgi:peptidyl-prolyl cis-trans isomerase A (cyclophilin A)
MDQLHRTALAAGALTIALLAAGCDDGCGDRTKLPDTRAVLLHPDSSAFKSVPPDTFRVLMTTSKGDVVIEVVREWAPMGAYRFYNLVRNGYFDGNRFFRVVPGFAAQFGATGYPKVEQAWENARLPADPVKVSNTRGMVTFAQIDPDSRSTQLFFNLNDNPQLDRKNFAPIGRVVSGWLAVKRLNDEYGELQPDGGGPAWRCVYNAGNRYLQKYYPRLDSITRAQLMEPGAQADTTRVP